MTEVEVRAATDADAEQVMALLASSLAFVPDERHREFFEWKHRDNPFGRSPAWVATFEGEVVGYRTFLRWEYERDGATIGAVRAVDTATHPAHRGRGVFARLTMHAVDAMRREGVRFVFNTPNTQSRPGYLKMGWIDLGRPPIRVRPRSTGGVVRTLRARVAAETWSLPTDAGDAAPDALADDESVTRLLDAIGPPAAGTLRTAHSPGFLRWRYGFGPLAYRAVRVGESITDGVLIFRLRQRGPAVEAAVVEVLVPPGGASGTRRALSRVLRSSGADYAIVLGPERRAAEGTVRLPAQGPRLTWRSVCDDAAAPLERWHLSLGDIELL